MNTLEDCEEVFGLVDAGEVEFVIVFIVGVLLCYFDDEVVALGVPVSG